MHQNMFVSVNCKKPRTGGLKEDFPEKTAHSNMVPSNVCKNGYKQTTTGPLICQNGKFEPDFRCGNYYGDLFISCFGIPS